ncbi:unnamed protein product [Bacillus thuringiensis DB27]|uniref:Uncharacterized protein n=1 Tax=Bacillus thuringiensis DB27 TaxID=1431339 RepID=W8YKZ2_BACTU|nr:unnamed protein product [Bacillus thuringiensis DB27]
MTNHHEFISLALDCERIIKQNIRFWCKERIRSQEIMRIPTGIILYAVNPNN